MYNIREFNRVVRDARLGGHLTQQELARRIGSSQSGIASLERGDGNPTVDTLARVAEAGGYTLRLVLEPLRATDPVVERYKQDVDRSSLRENLRKSVDERLRTLSEWQVVGDELQRATATARKKAARSRRTPP